ncbi:MAG: hypothetical protein ABWK04_02885 [Hydrogenobacter sp.]|uniref:hypothetical protein n=1 Tax=Hydrogenobacter thermophilus TaxID=940 RepID=UPI0030F66D6F
MRISELTQKQRKFLREVLGFENLPEDEHLDPFLGSRGFMLYRCNSCGKLIIHDGYEFWNLSECCDDNSKLMPEGVLCEVCYARSFENLKDWILFRPSWVKDVDFGKGV